MRLKWWQIMWRLLLDQRGEVGDLDSGDDDQKGDDDPKGDEEDMKGRFIMTDDDLPDTDDDDTDDKSKKKDADDIKTVVKNLEDRISSVESDNERLRKDKKDLQTALHQARTDKKSKKTDDDDEEVLSPTDIANIIKEHKDNPDVLVNAVNYLVSQKIKKGKSEAINEVEVRQMGNKLNSVLKQQFGTLLDDPDSDLRKNVDNIKKQMHVEDHPFADFLGTSVFVLDRLPMIIQNAVKKAGGNNVDKKRVDNIHSNGSVFKNGKQSDSDEADNGGNKKVTKLSKSQSETAERLGFKPGTRAYKIYTEKMLAKS